MHVRCLFNFLIDYSLIQLNKLYNCIDILFRMYRMYYIGIYKIPQFETNTIMTVRLVTLYMGYIPLSSGIFICVVLFPLMSSDWCFFSFFGSSSFSFILAWRMLGVEFFMVLFRLMSSMWPAKYE